VAKVEQIIRFQKHFVRITVKLFFKKL